MFHVERLRAEIKAAIKRGDMQMAWFLSGIVVLSKPIEAAGQMLAPDAGSSLDTHTSNRQALRR